MIEGVKVFPLKRIPDDRGKILHILKSSDEMFTTFGEVYCSTIYPGIVKAWHWHKEMMLNYVVIKGMIKFVLYDDRLNSPTYREFQEFYLGDENYARITVPPQVWNGFQCIGQTEAYVINITDIPHDPNEIKRLDPNNNEIISYDWIIKNR